MNKYQVIAICGESASGKDTILQTTLKKHPELFHPIVSCTTRPPRDYEKDGVDYHFITVQEFTNKVLAGDMLEAVSFNNWFYGSCIDDLVLDKINIGVFNPEGIKNLLLDSRLDVEVIRILCDDKTRLLRSLNREQNPDCEEICRRFFADKKDFSTLLDYDYWLMQNTDKTKVKCLDIMHPSNGLCSFIDDMRQRIQ